VCVQSADTPRDEQFEDLLNSRQKLEFHVSRTQTWLAHLGHWKAHVLHTDVSHSLFIVILFLTLGTYDLEGVKKLRKNQNWSL